MYCSSLNKMENKTTIVIGILLLLTLLLLGAGCGTIAIKDILNEPDKYMGKEVMVEGTVQGTVKIGSLSGFTLVDGNDKLAVSSRDLPAEGKRVVVQGTLMKEIFIGYYIYATKIYEK